MGGCSLCHVLRPRKRSESSLARGLCAKYRTVRTTRRGTLAGTGLVFRPSQREPVSDPEGQALIRPFAGVSSASRHGSQRRWSSTLCRISAEA